MLSAVWERSVANSIEQTVDRAMSLECWMDRGRVMLWVTVGIIVSVLFVMLWVTVGIIVSVLFVMLWVTVGIIVSVLFQFLTVPTVWTVLSNPASGLLQYTVITLHRGTFGYAATAVTWHQTVSSCISLTVQQLYQPHTTSQHQTRTTP
jgi:hypothetical protein